MIKNTLLQIVGIFSFFSFFGFVFALSDPEWVTHVMLPISSYHQYVDIPKSNSSIPKVVDIKESMFASTLSRGYLIVGSNATGTPVSGYLKPVSHFSPEAILSEEYPEMTDSNNETFTKIPFDSSTTTHTVKITLRSKKPITSEILTISLDKYVSSPDKVSLFAVTSKGVEAVVVDKPLSDAAFFPQTTASEWILVLSYTQPLRISEIFLNQINTLSPENHLLFLRQPGVSYRIYFNPEKEQGDAYNYNSELASAVDVDTLTLLPKDSVENPFFLQNDQDGDTIPDAVDNCPNISNKDQTDNNHNGRGDACDDDDYDGVINSVDTCPSIQNPDQRDTDNDKIGDACDSEENRLTEKYPWLPWVGIGSAGAVLLFLFGITAKDIMKSERINDGENKEQENGITENIK